MIEISLEQNKVMDEENFYRMRVTGHAGYAKKGQDIVCAAVSALVETLAAGVKDLERQGFCSAEVRMRSGEACIEVRYEERTIPKIVNEETMEMIFRGLAMTAEQYPEYIRAKREEG